MSNISAAESKLPTEVETIGSLVFETDPAYPYPFPVPKAPHFWMAEKTGSLANAVEIYLRGEDLSPADFVALRLYLQQYLERAVMTGETDRKRLIERLPKLQTIRELERFVDLIAESGIEPF